jgi:hypothetical protein
MLTPNCNEIGNDQKLTCRYEQDQERFRKKRKIEDQKELPLENDSFKESACLQLSRKVAAFRTWAAREGARKDLVSLLTLEKKCLKWYPTSKVYFNSLGTTFHQKASIGGSIASIGDSLSAETKKQVKDLTRRVLTNPDCCGVAGGVPSVFRDTSTATVRKGEGCSAPSADHNDDIVEIQQGSAPSNPAAIKDDTFLTVV